MTPTPQNKLPKLLYSTGSVTEPAYSDSRSGVVGNFHHTLGALVVEKDGPRFHVRNVSADHSGGFYDLNKYYSKDGVEDCGSVPALVTGDEHAIFADPSCKAATYLNDDSIVNTLRPEKIVRHDVFDAYTVSHHNRKDPVIQYGNHKFGVYKVEDELNLTIKHLEETTPEWAENLIVASNHHDHLTRWLKEVHVPATEPWNMDVWLELWGIIKESAAFKESGVACGDLFAKWSERRLKVPTKFLPVDSEEEIAGVVVGFHGHNGANGSRGSISQFAKIGAKTVIGHGHSPGILHGSFQVGTSSQLRLGYNAGPSSWAHAHCVIYPNGKRQIVFIVDGHWRLVDKKSKKNN
jgi:hypothetical protein